MKIVSVVGARPNFMKIAPFCRAIEEHNLQISQGCKDSSIIEHILVHTGQHYDHSMSGSFFEHLGIPAPPINLGVGSGTQAEQVGRTMIEFEKVLVDLNPDWVVVVGDVNATAACAITAKKEQMKLAHVEAGLRSFDMTMPEEVNRMVADRLSDLLFTPDKIASENLRKEGVPEEKIVQVGNIMIDTMEVHRKISANLDLRAIIRQNHHRECEGQTSLQCLRKFSVLTLHRPSNVDDQAVLSQIVKFLLKEVANDMAIIWPVHPRTHERLISFGLWNSLCANKQMILLQPISYQEMLRLNMSASVMFTDSGGIQEECCVLGTPCLTLRWNTERPVTLLERGGVSILVGNDIDRIHIGYRELTKIGRMSPCVPPLWDGRTADRIVATFRELI